MSKTNANTNEPIGYLVIVNGLRFVVTREQALDLHRGLTLQLVYKRDRWHLFSVAVALTWAALAWWFGTWWSVAFVGWFAHVAIEQFVSFYPSVRRQTVKRIVK